MRIGILGGTFNPVHCAHLQVATDALGGCDLDRVLFIPTNSPPHKELAGDVSFTHRYAMVEAALAVYPAFEACDLEGRRGGISFSVHTLEQLQQERPGDELYFIMGMDSFVELSLWRSYRRLFELAHLVVLVRPGAEIDDPLARVPIAMAGEFCYAVAPKGLKTLQHSNGNKVFFIEEHRLDISSTQIRRRVNAGDPIGELVPDAVHDYIARHRLYSPQER